ncbi:putative F-box protein At3g16210 [Papaver somniferum]|uniref:putative F-box protein At3g16210 n=1 Tax=Papaver somniferum TaxID=3469 RepID=UPI000E6F843C|nr:putative F-box protein At3g16210 [Papaver somniferum]
MSGFGYSPSTDEYKVVRIYHKGNTCCFQVFILVNESNKWTEEKEIPYPFFHNECQYSKGVLVNGEIRWLDYASKTVAFNLANEEFHQIASPPLVEGSSYSDYMKLFVLGDCLCLVHYRYSARERTHVDIWLLKKNNDISVQQNGYCSWKKECTVQVERGIDLIPLAFTKKGKILFFQVKDFRDE